jgi:hypothetical protein
VITRFLPRRAHSASMLCRGVRLQHDSVGIRRLSTTATGTRGPRHAGAVRPCWLRSVPPRAGATYRRKESSVDLGRFDAARGRKATNIHLYEQMRLDLGRFHAARGTKATNIHLYGQRLVDLNRSDAARASLPGRTTQDGLVYNELTLQSVRTFSGPVVTGDSIAWKSGARGPNGAVPGSEAVLCGRRTAAVRDRLAAADDERGDTSDFTGRSARERSGDSEFCRVLGRDRTTQPALHWQASRGCGQRLVRPRRGRRFQGRTPGDGRTVRFSLTVTQTSLPPHGRARRAPMG